MSRIARIERTTKESQVKVEVDLDGTGRSDVSTGVGFYDHMLDAFARHSLTDLVVHTSGDTHIDAHHSVEDTAIVLGQALREALGDKSGIRRFGDATVPLDEALVQAVVDVSGRPYCVHTGEPEGQVYAAIGGSGVAYEGSLTRTSSRRSPCTATSRCTSACSPAATRTTSSRRSSRRSRGRSATPSRSTPARRVCRRRRAPCDRWRDS